MTIGRFCIEASGVFSAQLRRIYAWRLLSALVSNRDVNLTGWFLRRLFPAREPENLRRGRIGELAARKRLRKRGMKFLAANFRSVDGEIDLIFRDPVEKGLAGLFAKNAADCLVFVEVKTRSSEEWTRPAAAVDAAKRRRLCLCALDYLSLLRSRDVKFRFDIVEVLLSDGQVSEVRHLPNAFPFSGSRRRK